MGKVKVFVHADADADADAGGYDNSSPDIRPGELKRITKENTHVTLTLPSSSSYTGKLCIHLVRLTYTCIFIPEKYKKMRAFMRCSRNKKDTDGLSFKGLYPTYHCSEFLTFFVGLYPSFIDTSIICFIASLMMVAYPKHIYMARK